MTEGKKSEPEFPSVDIACPLEQGGPIARIGFDYQDEVAVSFCIQMLGDPTLVKIHCESHDDILLIWAADGAHLAEFVQVKGAEPDKLWSISDLCRRESGTVGSSLYETSLARDKHKEPALFRLVTLRPVVNAMEILSYPRQAPGREPCGRAFQDLMTEINERCGNAKSDKGNGAAFWIHHCYWDTRHDSRAVALANELNLLRLAAWENRPLLPEQAQSLLEELRRRVKKAGAARWQPSRDQKILTRVELRAWWEFRTDELRDDASSPAGGKLAEKLRVAGASDETIALAIDLRRSYAAAVRTSQYMDDEDAHRLQLRVKSELMSLRAGYAAGLIDIDGVGFHSLCLESLKTINNERIAGIQDQSAFLQGCMYDIADRCLHRFARLPS